MKLLFFLLVISPLSMAAQICGFNDGNGSFSNGGDGFNDGQTCITSLKSLGIYPNPTVYELSINGLDNDTEGAVFNVAGQLVLSIKRLETPLNVAHLAQGVYFLKIAGQAFKFVKL